MLRFLAFVFSIFIGFNAVAESNLGFKILTTVKKVVL